MYNSLHNLLLSQTKKKKRVSNFTDFGVVEEISHTIFIFDAIFLLATILLCQIYLRRKNCGFSF